MAQACLFLAAKVEEQPRKLEHVIKVAHMILHRDQPPLDTKSVVSTLGSSLYCTVKCCLFYFHSEKHSADLTQTHDRLFCKCSYVVHGFCHVTRCVLYPAADT